MDSKDIIFTKKRYGYAVMSETINILLFRRMIRKVGSIKFNEATETYQFYPNPFTITYSENCLSAIANKLTELNQDKESNNNFEIP